MSYVLLHYPDAVRHERADGSTIYTVEMTVGGLDEQGEFLFVLDGPAQGEKVYL